MVNDVSKGRMYNVSTFRGLSTDTKPTDTENGAEFQEIDTGDIYFFNAAASTWIRVGTIDHRPTTEQIAEATATDVTAWLDEHITEGIAVDDTLTVSGAAADAKVTGDELEYVKDTIFDSPNPLNTFAFTRQGYAHGTTQFTYTDEFAPCHRASVPDEYKTSPSQGQGYSLLAFRFDAKYKIDVLKNSGETINDLVFIFKSNKKIWIYPYLSTDAPRNPGIQSIATSENYYVNQGITVVKPTLTYTSYNHDSNYYRWFGFQFTTPSNIADMELDLYIVRGSELYDWILANNDALQSEINTLTQAVENVTPIYDTDMLFWGDSLTAGAGGNGTTYPAVCASELNKTYKNCGVGGESANTISARQGGNAIIIPAGAINGTYNDGFTDVYGGTVIPLRQGNGSSSGSKLYIDGEECTLTISQTTSTSDDAVYTIAGYTGGTSAVPLLGRFKGSDYTGDIVVIWVGTNGARVGETTDITARISIIDSMIAHIGHDRYVVMGLSRGTASDNATDDATMLLKYGARYFPTRKMLSSYGLALMGLTPTEQDTTDMASGKVPDSLRSDAIHLNADGYTALGLMLADKIKSMGFAR